MVYCGILTCPTKCAIPEYYCTTKKRKRRRWESERKRIRGRECWWAFKKMRVDKMAKIT